MADHRVTFDLASAPVRVPTGTLVSEAARLAGLDIQQPCGGQGRCGRCAVLVTEGTARARSTLRLSASDIAAGYGLACQLVIEGDISISIPPQERIERRLTTDLSASEVVVPPGYDPGVAQSVRRVPLTLPPPSMSDQTDDLSRLRTALRQQAGIADVRMSLDQLRRLGRALREGDWRVTAVLDTDDRGCAGCPARLIDLQPGHVLDESPLWGAAIDIGTTTVSLWLVDLRTGGGARRSPSTTRR